MASSKRAGRALDQIRGVEMTPGFHRLSEGSVLYRAEGTVVLAVASVDHSVPEFLKGKGRPFLTALAERLGISRVTPKTYMKMLRNKILLKVEEAKE